MVKVAIDTTDDAESRPKPVKTPAVKASARRKSRWLLKLTFLTAVFAFAAPSVISLTGQAPAVLKKIHPKLAGAVSFRSLTLHWWAPVELTQLKVLDLSETLADSDPVPVPLLCEVEQITTVEPLWRIALNAGRGTGILVKSPRLNLIADERGTNIDRTMTAIFGETSTTDEARFPFRVTIDNGSVELQSALSPPVVVTDINGACSTMDTARWLPEMKLTASIHKDVSRTVSKRSGVNGRSGSRPARLAAGLEEVVSDFPSVPLEDLAGTDESGDNTGARIQIHLKPRADEKGRQTIQLGARDVDLRLLQPFLALMGIDVSCDGIVSGGIDARLAGANLKDGIVGRLMLQGDNVRVRQQFWASDEWLGLGNIDASGAVAIAEDGMLVQDLKILTGVAQLTGSGELRHNHRTAKSEDATSGGSQQVELAGTVDVARLVSSLRNTLAIHPDVDVERGQLTFGLKCSAETIPSPPDAPALSLSNQSLSHEQGSWQLVVRTENLAAVRAGKPLSVDSNLRMEAVGPLLDGLPHLSRARLTADFGTIDCVPDGTAWRLTGLVQPVSLWQQLQQFADLPQPGLKGDVRFQSRVAVQGDLIQLNESLLNSSDVRASSKALTITRSRPLTGMFDGDLHLEGSGAALRTLLAPWHDASWLAGSSHVVTDLTASPTQAIQLTVRIAPDQLATLPRHNIQSVSRTAGRPVSSGSSLVNESSFVIDEVDATLSLIAKDAGRLFEIQTGSVKVPGVVALITGTVAVPQNDLLLDLTADATYDLDVLSRRLLTPDSGLHFSGQGRDQFRLTGSPSAMTGIAQHPAGTAAGSATLPVTLKGSGTVTWASADIVGLQAGKASVQATLENSLLRSAPIQCSLNGGELNVMPQYDLASSRLALGTGSRVQNLRLTPELCRNWLGYVAPLIADTAQVSGEVSARVERFVWDVNSPQNSDVMAQLTIHRAEAAAGSSLLPLLEIVELLRRRGDGSPSLSERSIIFPEQTIPVQIRQGYVTHDGLVMELNGYRMRTAGAVGFNSQLQMTMEIPLEKTTTAGTGRSIRVPLRGTISQPQPDTAALLQNLGTQKIQQKVDEQLDKTLNKQLNKLFDKF